MTMRLALDEIEVDLYSVPGCPNVARTRRLLCRWLAEAGIRGDVVEHIGEYPSPTVVIDGHDVMGDAAPGPACRLDLPTREAVLRALAPHRGERVIAADGGEE